MIEETDTQLTEDLKKRTMERLRETTIAKLTEKIERKEGSSVRGNRMIYSFTLASRVEIVFHKEGYDYNSTI